MKRNWETAVLVFVLLIISDTLNAEVTSLEEMTITAQKREESAQNVPISISVLTSYDIEDKSIESVNDIAPFIPNLTLHDNGGRGSLSPTIRGMHTESGSFSPAVVMFIDGIPAPGTTGFDLPLTDIQRVEVLKGPQGTLYGKGAEAGVINIVTRRPGNNADAAVIAEMGSDNKRQYDVTAHGPIVRDKLFIGISGRHYEKDGFIDNLNQGGYSDDRAHNYGKVYLRFTPSRDVEVSWISSGLRHEDGGQTWGLKDAPRTNTSEDEFIDTQLLSNALKIRMNAMGHTIESITTHLRLDDEAWLDYDYTANNIYEIALNSRTTDLSQEFRFSRHTRHLDYLAGINLAKNDNILDYTMYLEGAPSPTYTLTDTKSYGTFIHTTFRVTDALSLENGIRYDRNFNHYQDPDQDLDLESDSWAVSPKTAVVYKFSGQTTAYATIARGYRPGGFYAYAPSGYPKTYDKETLWSYEIGSKHRFGNGRLALNTALYFMDITDMQVTSSIAGTSSTYKSNAARATAKGLECELTYRFRPDLEFFLSGGYNAVTFDRYEDATGDYSGNTPPYAPRYNFSFGAQYRNAPGLFARMDISGNSRIFLDKANTIKRAPYSLINLKLGYETERYDIYLYGKNILDKVYDAVGYSSRYTIYSPPREIGVRLSLRF